MVMMGIAAFALLMWSAGKVDLLVVLYSINVFLTLQPVADRLVPLLVEAEACRLNPWMGRMLLSLIGLLVTASILVVTVIEKFNEGGWMTILITALVIAICLVVRTHYRETKDKIRMVDRVFADQPFGGHVGAIEPNPEEQTAVFIVGNSRGGGLHALLWVQRMFPGHFKNFIFINARTVDSHAYGGDGALEQMRAEANATLKFFVDFCHSHGMASASKLSFGTDVVDQVTQLCIETSHEYPNSIFFTSKLIFETDNWFTRLLHNQAALALQRRLHFDGLQMVVLPMKVVAAGLVKSYCAGRSRGLRCSAY